MRVIFARVDRCRGSIRAEQVALTQGWEIAAGEPSQSLPRLTRVRISYVEVLYSVLSHIFVTDSREKQQLLPPLEKRANIHSSSALIGVSRADQDRRRRDSTVIARSFPYPAAPSAFRQGAPTRSRTTRTI